jgi:hypothetical protein
MYFYSQKGIDIKLSESVMSKENSNCVAKYQTISLEIGVLVT